MLIRKTLVSIVLATATLGAASLLMSTEAAARHDVYIRVAPPVQYVEAVPSYRSGYVWVPGYWDWRADRHGGRHVWVEGSWLRERHGYAYRPHRWVDNGGHWVQERGHWDRDGDGVPNRYDRYPNNPYRR